MQSINESLLFSVSGKVVVIERMMFGAEMRITTMVTLILQRSGHVKCLSQTITKIEFVVMEYSLGKRKCTLSSTRLLHVCTPFERLFPSDLILVELCKVVDNDGDGESNDKNSADAADQANTLAQEGGGHHVTIANRGHADGRPPEGRGNAGELSVLNLTLCEVAEAREYEDPHGHKHEQQSEFLIGIANCEAETLESRGMSR